MRILFLFKTKLLPVRRNGDRIFFLDLNIVKYFKSLTVWFFLSNTGMETDVINLYPVNLSLRMAASWKQE